MFGRNKTPQVETPQVETPQAGKLSLTELVSVHAAAVVDKKAKQKIWDDAYMAHRDAIAKLSRLDAAIVNSDATLQRIRALKESADTAWNAYYHADEYSDKTFAAISA